MAYIGKAPGGTGVRQRYLYTATSGQTTFTTSDSGLALSYSDTNYMDVYQNGVLLDPANDYTATSGTSVVLGTGATTGDVIEIIVYDVFSVFNNTVTGNFTVGNNLTVSGTSTLATVDINAGNIDGTTIGAATPAAGTFTTLTANGNAVISSANARLRLKETDTTDVDTQLQTTGGVFKISRLDDDDSTATQRFTIDNSTGDISFYEDTGTTAKLFWDASAEALGIGATTLDATLQVGALGSTGSNRGAVSIKTEASDATIGESAIYIEEQSGSEGYYLGVSSDGGMFFSNSGASTPTLFLGDDDNVGIGTSSPDTNFEISDTSGPVLRLSGHTGGAIGVTPYDIGSIEFKSDDSSGEGPRVVATVKTEADTASTVPGGELVFETRGPGNGTSLDERMRIDSSGNVGIGVATPSTSLDVVRNGVQPLRVQNTSGTEVQINMVNTGGNVQLEAHSGNFNIDADKVGIGTTSPSSNAIVKFLEIQDSTSAGVVLDAARVFSMYSSSSSTLAFRDETASANRMIIDSSGRVGIGTGSIASDATVHIDGTDTLLLITEDSEGKATLRFGDTQGNLSQSMALAFNTSNKHFTFTADGTTERLRILSGGGITFNGDTAAANALDDYEEGTWTPDIKLVSSGSSTYSSRSGQYTKIGNLCTVTCVIHTTAHSGSGTAYIHGLPFAHASSSESIGSCQMNAHSDSHSTDIGSINSIIQSGESVMHMRATYNTNASGPLYIQLQNFTYLRITITYRTA
jgi:hypothetical protein